MEIEAVTTGAPPPDIAPDIRVGFLLSPSFTLLPFAGFIEALRHAADEADRSRQIYCKWTCIGVDRRPVTASCGVEIAPWEDLGDPTRFDYIAIVGGLMSAFAEHDARTFAFLRHAYASEVPLIGLCTGTFALAEAGLLDGRRCAVHWRHAQELAARYPAVTPVTGEPYVADDIIFTCPGGITSINLAVALIERHCGKARALKTLTQMVVGPEHTHIASLPRIFEELAKCGDWRVERAVGLMRHSLAEPCSIEALAAQLGTSVRQLDRAFAAHARMSPAAFWRRMRLEHARWRLSNSSRAVTEIAFECGFSDGSHLTRWFHATYGESPKRYRRSRLKVAET